MGATVKLYASYCQAQSEHISKRPSRAQSIPAHHPGCKRGRDVVPRGDALRALWMAREAGMIESERGSHGKMPSTDIHFFTWTACRPLSYSAVAFFDFAEN